MPLTSSSLLFVITSLWSLLIFTYNFLKSKNLELENKKQKYWNYFIMLIGHVSTWRVLTTRLAHANKFVASNGEGILVEGMVESRMDLQLDSIPISVTILIYPCSKSNSMLHLVFYFILWLCISFPNLVLAKMKGTLMSNDGRSLPRNYY